ncbi:MAG: MoaD/ThiS family protein [Thermodesulfobacteriota bacterium]
MSAAKLKDLTRLQQPARAPSGQVKISYGVHHLEVAIAGKSVGEVRQALKEPLNIDPRALALVNGRDVAASYVLKEGDQLEFVRLAGEKGTRSICGHRASAPCSLHQTPSLNPPTWTRKTGNALICL